jgi:UDP-N-acetylglucosamine 2-epimerase (non-hydrolysing)
VASKILCVVGARPNLMKMAPIIGVLRADTDRFRAQLVHTGQHYDAAMNDQFFEALDIPRPDISLDVGSGSHAVQTAEVMRRFEPVLDQEAPVAVLVVGDVNSTLACSLVAAKKNVPVIHVEAGLRSFDRTMPEEINRVLTDQISDLLFTTERGARDNLLREGVADEKIHFVGNVMIDTLRAQLKHATPVGTTLTKYMVPDHLLPGTGSYALLTLHRPANVDDPGALKALLNTIEDLSRMLPVIFPAHPRTRNRIGEFGLLGVIERGRMVLLPPLGYHEMLGMMKGAKLVLTDSGGVQEETTALGIPCVTLRQNTERPITVTQGTNTVTGTDPDRIKACVEEILVSGGKTGRIPELWDGNAAQRIGAILGTRFYSNQRRHVA